ncbi:MULTISPECIES: hypothetical protein [Oxalobacteraceae]|jgi:hypothetical protein|nr:hypothetical protein [Noviherbaspirillum sp. Root189]
MQQYIDSYRTAYTFNEYLIRSSVEYWTAMSFPAIYLAKYL